MFHIKIELNEVYNKIFVAYNLRFHPIIQKIKYLIANEDILFINVRSGQYLPMWRPDSDYRNSYSSSKNKGGGALLDLSHEIDYIQWLFGDFVIKGSIITKISDLEIDSDDIVTVIARIKNNNALLNFTMDYLSKKPIREIIIYANEKDIIADLIKSEITINYKNGSSENMDFKDIGRDFTYKKMHESLLNGENTYLCSYYEGLKVLDVIEKIWSEN